MPFPQRSTGRPFLAAPRPGFYFPSQLAESARAELERGIRRAEGVGLVVGPTGTGKSLLMMKLAEDLRDDFDVALLSGARICTRRALWQSILSEIGEPYRGLEENDLRMSVLERVRGLAATCSGLVVLVDEAQTLPTRLIEELRLLTTVPTPLPAVHLVLAGTRELEEMLAGPKLESLSQRIVVRNYLEPFDHTETCAFVRGQCRTAGMDWDARFADGCDHAVFTISDGVPRLINQICDHALLGVEEGERLRPRHIEQAWREIQRLPPATVACDEEAEVRGGEPSTISFGSLDDGEVSWDEEAESGEQADWEGRPAVRTDGPHRMASVDAGQDDHRLISGTERAALEVDPFQGPDVEFFFDASRDPFGEMFEDEEEVVERYLVTGSDDFRGCTSVVSREGAGIARDLTAIDEAAEQAEERMRERSGGRSAASILHGETIDVERLRRAKEEDVAVDTIDADTIDADVTDADTLDADMIIVEEDLLEDASSDDRGVFAVRPADYRTLFARLRRG